MHRTQAYHGAKIVQSFLDFLPAKPYHRTGVSKRGLVISGLRVAVEGKEILKGIDLTVEPGNVHALMGPNGSGKSTLAFAMSGHPNYRGPRAARSTLDGSELARRSRPTSGRAPGSSSRSNIRPRSRASRSRTSSAPRAWRCKPDDLPPAKFREMIYEKLDVLDMDPAFLSRYVNDGFSGGEKKRLEMLQLAMLAPKYAILDETDSGLDVDALQSVGHSIEAMRASDDGKRDRLPDHHPLPAHSAPRPGRRRAHHDGRPHREDRRPRSRGAHRARGLRRDSRRGRRWRRLALTRASVARDARHDVEIPAGLDSKSRSSSTTTSPSDDRRTRGQRRRRRARHDLERLHGAPADDVAASTEVNAGENADVRTPSSRRSEHGTRRREPRMSNAGGGSARGVERRAARRRCGDRRDRRRADGARGANCEIAGALLPGRRAKSCS